MSIADELESVMSGTRASLEAAGVMFSHTEEGTIRRAVEALRAAGGNEAQLLARIDRLTRERLDMNDALRLIASARSRGFDLFYAEGCADGALRRATLLNERPSAAERSDENG